MARLNTAVREHLRQVADSERGRTVRWVVQLRAFVATLYTLQILYYTVLDPLPEARRTLPLFVGYTFLAGVVALAVSLDERLARPAGYTLGLLDLPVMMGAVILAIPVTETPAYLVFSMLAFSSLLVMATILTLDYGAIAIATVVGVVGTTFVVRQVGAPWVEVGDPLFGTLAAGGLALFIVSRVRGFITESRRRDFAGKYVLGRRLGAGGMAEVFAATYSPEGGFEREVAVKRVLPAHASNEEYVALFRREAELASRLQHPNLVQVLDFGRDLDTYFLAMELIEGVNLSACLPPVSNTRLPVNAALYVVGELAEALTYLHERPSAHGSSVGLVHRDLNPPNVLISRRGEVKVTDFGIARWADSEALTRDGSVRGKLAYLAPELLQGAPPTTAADLFSLGVLAFELLSGRRLFGGHSEQATVKALLEANLPSLGAECPALAAPVVAVLDQLLERDPTRRVSSARLVTSVLRGSSGPEAPYPHGRAALVAALRAHPASVQLGSAMAP